MKGRLRGELQTRNKCGDFPNKSYITNFDPLWDGGKNLHWRITSTMDLGSFQGQVVFHGNLQVSNLKCVKS